MKCLFYYSLKGLEIKQKLSPIPENKAIGQSVNADQFKL